MHRTIGALVTGPPNVSRVRAVTFDWWGTLYLYADASNTRLQLLQDFLRGHGLDPDRDRTECAYAAATQHLDREWRAGRTYSSAQWLARVVNELGLPTGAPTTRNLLCAMEEAMLERPPRLVEGAADLLSDLRLRGVSLGIISDTALTVGRVMRRILEADGILHHFRALVFSDETGVPKPHRKGFEAALALLSARPEEAAHVGDLPETDIAGAKAIGMRAVLISGISGREDSAMADAVVRDFAGLRSVFGDWGLLPRPEHPRFQ